MRTTPTVVGVYGIVILLLTASVLVLVQDLSSAVTIRHLECVQFRDGFIATFGVTNRTSGTCSVFPLRLEIRNGSSWKVSASGMTGFSAPPDLGPRAGVLAHCVLTKLPAGSHLRLVMEVRKERRGINSFMLRMKLWLKGDKRHSLNPFDRKVIFESKELDIISDEFVQPE